MNTLKSRLCRQYVRSLPVFRQLYRNLLSRKDAHEADNAMREHIGDREQSILKTLTDMIKTLTASTYSLEGRLKELKNKVELNMSEVSCSCLCLSHSISPLFHVGGERTVSEMFDRTSRQESRPE